MSPAVGNMELEKKRSAIRTQLHRLRDRQFGDECREFIRAIRYLRLRNDELRTLDFLARLQTALQRVSNEGSISEIHRMAMIAVQQRRRQRRRRRAPASTGVLGSKNRKRSPPR
ncbi:unnamed protein product [Cylindrotheca closterium]|uniref:Uncharacterized protein n=1 Tax=Cylindrotheca closterium TaxID=2856 RepID=A0AAD2G3L3_9STRA|nr:unnamed protein product [Cylindrotheca closterium]